MALWGLVEAGQLTSDQFKQLGAAAVAAANIRGVALANLGLTAEAIRQLRTPVAPQAVPPTAVQADQERIRADIDRILTSTDTPNGELERLGRSEPLLTVATTIQTGLRRHGFTGWTRGLSGGSCPKCVGWADGVVRSPETRMARHVGCDCIQQPVIT